MFVEEREGDPKKDSITSFQEKGMFIFTYITILCQFKCWEYCFQDESKNESKNSQIVLR